MSVILDALKKLDREKSFRKRGTANIALEILRPDLTHPGRRLPISVIIVVVAAVVAAAFTYGVMSQFGGRSKSSPPAIKTVSAASQQSAPVSPKSEVTPRASHPATVSFHETNKQIPASVPRLSVPKVQEEVNRLPAKPQPPAEKKDRADVKIPVEGKNLAPPSVDQKQSQDTIPKEVGITPKKTPEPATATTAVNPESLKVSAIVWYEDATRRFVMINGVLAREGSFVEGAKVVEINPTSVRLSHNGQYFELSMSK